MTNDTFDQSSSPVIHRLWFDLDYTSTKLFDFPEHDLTLFRQLLLFSLSGHYSDNGLMWQMSESFTLRASTNLTCAYVHRCAISFIRAVLRRFSSFITFWLVFYPSMQLHGYFNRLLFKFDILTTFTIIYSYILHCYKMMLFSNVAGSLFFLCIYLTNYILHDTLLTIFKLVHYYYRFIVTWILPLSILFFYWDCYKLRYFGLRVSSLSFYIFIVIIIYYVFLCWDHSHYHRHFIFSSWFL